MRKSAAPSQVHKHIGGPKARQSQLFFPDKASKQSLKRICRDINQDDGLQSKGRVPSSNGWRCGDLNLLKLSIPQAKSEKENVTIQPKSPVFALPKGNSCINPSVSTKPAVFEKNEYLSSFATNQVSENTEFVNRDSNDVDARYYSAVWCKLSKKKHKKWEGDAIVIVKARSVILKDLEGKEIGRGSGYKLKDLESLEEGNTLAIGAKEIEIQSEMETSYYTSGKCFQGSLSFSIETEHQTIPARPKLKPFRLPFKENVTRHNVENNSPKQLFDASDVHALVLPKPPAHLQTAICTDSLPIVNVVVDPHLSGRLRLHQKVGVVFLYECVMGFRVKSKYGAILADEMGLGKTLQCITLVWTLLKQGPYGGIPSIKRVLIVTPSSLVANWGKEFDKWLGKERLQLFIVDQHNKAGDFTKQKHSPVLIISYEMLVRCIDKVGAMNFDLMLCDEGHRLKNWQIKTTTLLSNLKIKRKVIVTGTPIQNDLQELYSLVEFVNPGIFGSSLMFRKVYEEYILRAQYPSASREEKEMGEDRAKELNRLASQFTLRRTQDIINRYLPPKTEYVVFCKPAKTQSDLYESLVGSRGLQRCLTNSFVGDHLAAICILRKLCNHPGLLSVNVSKEQQSELQNEIAHLIPQELKANIYLEEHSGKLAVISCMLWSLCEERRERIVIVSNFTTTLDMLQQLCERYKYPFLRLDGSTPASKRQALVDKFNKSYCEEFVFLLSTKAGGVGLNLIGASRIILYDIDWNPATDLQAMARVWRDGQKKNVSIYRLLLAGSIEEKMYQRQVCKQGISGSIVDARSNSKVQFSVEELKDLFRFYPDVSCLTHDQLNCPCDQMGEQNIPNLKRPLEQKGFDNAPRHNSTTMDQLFNWKHFSFPGAAEIIDDLYLKYASEFITYLFKCQNLEENELSQ